MAKLGTAKTFGHCFLPLDLHPSKASENMVLWEDHGGWDQEAGFYFQPPAHFLEGCSLHSSKFTLLI